MAKTLSFNNGVFTLTVDHIDGGTAKITLTQNAPLTFWANASNVLDALREIGSGAADLQNNYYLRELIKEEIRATEGRKAENEELSTATVEVST